MKTPFATTLFENQWTHEARPTVTPQHSEMEAFAGWERIIAMLGEMADVVVDSSTDLSTNSAVAALRNANVLAIHTPHPSWAVRPERSAEVSTYAARHLTMANDFGEVAHNLAEWSSRGGTQGGELTLIPATVERLLEVASQHIARLAAEAPEQWGFTDRSFEGSLEYFHVQPDAADFTYYSPLLNFVRDAAIASAPALYWRFISDQRRDRVYASVTTFAWNALLDAEPSSIAHDPILVAQAVGLFLALQQYDRAREVLRGAHLSELNEALGQTKVLIVERRPLDETWSLLGPIWEQVPISADVIRRLWTLMESHQNGLELLDYLGQSHLDGHHARDLMISEWVRQLPLRNQPASRRGDLAFYRADEITMANTVVRQFMAFSQPGQEYSVRVLQRLSLAALTRPFARESEYQGWRDTANAAARVLFVGSRILAESPNEASLAEELAQIATQLNTNQWGDASHDLMFVNAAIALARGAQSYSALSDATGALLAEPSVPLIVRLTVALWLDDSADGIESRTAGLDVDHALEAFLPAQRLAIASTFARRLEILMPMSILGARLEAIASAPRTSP